MKTVEKTEHILAPKKRSLPKNWRKMIGLLRGRRTALEKHVETVRNEWVPKRNV